VVPVDTDALELADKEVRAMWTTPQPSTVQDIIRCIIIVAKIGLPEKTAH